MRSTNACRLTTALRGSKILLIRKAFENRHRGGARTWSTTRLVSCSGHVNDSKLRGLAVTSPKRRADFPHVPTMVESGRISDDVLDRGGGAGRYARTDRHARLNLGINEGLHSADMKQRFAQLQVEPRPGSP